MLGFDLTREVSVNKQRAMLQYGANFAWLTNDKAVIMQPNTEPKSFLNDGNHLLK